MTLSLAVVNVQSQRELIQKELDIAIGEARRLKRLYERAKNFQWNDLALDYHRQYLKQRRLAIELAQSVGVDYYGD